MSALDELLKEIPQGYDEVDVANHLLHFREAATAELATLRAQLEEAKDVIKPFTHDDLCEVLGGNTIGVNSMVYVRNRAELRLKHFRAAAAWYNKVTTA